jgi:hypothetical protein
MNTPPKIGDLVSVNHPKYPGTWKVAKVGPVNVVVEPTEGQQGGRPLRCPPSLLTEPGQTPRVYDSVLYNPGELVRIPTGKHAGIYVVIADRGADKVNIARLGGDGGAYLRALRGSISKVDATEIVRNDYQFLVGGA